MNARRVNAAAGVILAAQKQRSTAAGIAMALEAAGLLQSPESAAELEALRARADKAERAYTFDTATLKKRIAELETLVSRLGARAEQRHLVDPLDHVLEHLADERPKSCGCGHTFDAHCRDGCAAPAYHSGLLGLCGCTAEVTA